MSQHYFKTIDKDGSPIAILMGWDRPLNHLFLIVERTMPDGYVPSEAAAREMEDSILYSSMNEPEPFFLSLDDLRGRLSELGLEAPASVYEQIEIDRSTRAGNRIVYHNDDGTFKDLNLDGAARERTRNN